MKTKLISGIITLFLVLSCDSSFEDLNNNQNSITTDEVIPPSLLIKGTMLANVAINNSHLQRIAGMWTGQYRGEISLYLGIYNYVVRVVSPENFQGLEASCAIVGPFTDVGRPLDSSLYVSLSRAIAHLVLVGTEGGLAKLVKLGRQSS